MFKEHPWVHIVGTGTIGEPILYLFLETQKDLGLETVSFHKKRPLPEDTPKIKKLMARGARLVVDRDQYGKFIALGTIPYSIHEAALESADIVIDCTPNGNELKYEHYLKLSGKYPKKGFIAQGSEENFGIPFAWTINDKAMMPEHRYLQVVSCGTHQLVCLLFTLLFSHEESDNLRYGKFFIARRGSDISEDRLNPGVEAEAFKKKYEPYGTHQGYDAARVIKTIYGELANIPIHSQIIKVPTQYMHTMLFDIELKKPMRRETALARLKSNPLIVFTKLKSNNRISDRARNASPIRGRILNQTVFYKDSFDVSPDGLHIRGTCFTPQDGNSLLSSMAATLWLLNPDTYKEKMKVFDKFLFSEI